MSFNDIFDAVISPDGWQDRSPRYMDPDIDVLEIVDSLFRTKTWTDKEEKSCLCGCAYQTDFFDLIELPEDYFKIIMLHCIEKKYITIDDHFQDLLCKKLIRIHVDDENIDIILWLIENYITTEKLNSFLYDYNYDTEEKFTVEEKPEIVKYPQSFYSLMQIFYNIQSFNETHMPIVFDVFRKKNFDFVGISKKSKLSLLSRAISSIDLYSLCEFHKEGCEFNEDCYTSLMDILRRRIGRLKDDADDQKEPKEHGDGSWSNCERILNRELLKDSEMIKMIFQPHLLDHQGNNEDEQNHKLIKFIEQYVIEKFSHLPKFQLMKESIMEEVSSYYYRSCLVPNLQRLQYNWEILEYCVKVIKIDLHHECFVEQENHDDKPQLEHPTLLNGYLYGSLPIQLIYPDWHERIVQLLKP